MLDLLFLKLGFLRELLVYHLIITSPFKASNSVAETFHDFSLSFIGLLQGFPLKGPPLSLLSEQFKPHLKGTLKNRVI